MGDEPSGAQTSYVVFVERLVRIEVKLDELLKAQDKGHEDHETRLRAIERWKYALPLTALTAVASAVVATAAFLGR